LFIIFIEVFKDLQGTPTSTSWFLNEVVAFINLIVAKVDKVQGNRRRPIGVKGRLEFRDEVGFEGTNLTN
jgi:hypothetical protein